LIDCELAIQLHLDELCPLPSGTSDGCDIPLLDVIGHEYRPGTFQSLECLRKDHLAEAIGCSDFDISTIDSLDLRRKALVLQSWLFFAFISEFFRKHVAPDKLFDPNRQVLALQRNKMAGLVKDWYINGHRSGSMEDTLATLDFVSRQCELYDPEQLEGKPSYEERQLAAVLLSIKLLLSYFKSVIRHYPKPGTVTKWFNPALARAHGVVQQGMDNSNDAVLPLPPGSQKRLSTHLLLECFSRNGWCQVRARQICETLDYRIAHYLSRVRRSDSQEVSHDECEGQRCTAYDMTEDQKTVYKPKHVANCTGCKLIKVDEHRLGTMVLDNKIALVSIDPAGADLDVELYE
jgi:hypothetical protein